MVCTAQHSTAQRDKSMASLAVWVIAREEIAFDKTAYVSISVRNWYLYTLAGTFASAQSQHAISDFQWYPRQGIHLGQ